MLNRTAERLARAAHDGTIGVPVSRSGFFRSQTRRYFKA